MNHRDEVLRLLERQIGNKGEVDEISRTADEVKKKWVPPMEGGEDWTNGLIYGFVQSGKTGVLSVTGAIGADEGYETIIILTSDINPLYEQTFGRIQQAYPGIDIIGKNDFRNQDSFIKRVRMGKCAIVTSKNVSTLQTLVQNFKAGRLRGLRTLIIDDEADQASLNTRASKKDGTLSAINRLIDELRSLFGRNTYLQVTATPQALFLQTPGHDFRPRFTVLSNPGAEYIGGEDFFGDNASLVREFDLAHINDLVAAGQPKPSLSLPVSLVRALDTFMVGATFKRYSDPTQNCAFLCHVSTRRDDHNHIYNLMLKYKEDLIESFKNKKDRLKTRLEEAYEDLSASHEPLRKIKFDHLIDKMIFFSPGINVKLVNGDTDEDVAVTQPYNLFVGGNKLGRGVTIKNLLVSYYGRNPRQPQADTVLQHARMYGYRRKDIGLIRLFLPSQLHVIFRAIYRMEKSLRETIQQNPGEEFRGVYMENPLLPTRRNILAPGSIGVYSGGGIYNPAQVLRTKEIKSKTDKLDELLKKIQNKQYIEMTIEEMASLIELCMPDGNASEKIWNSIAVAGSLRQFAELKKQKKGYVYVDRDRELKESRRETQGILDGGEASRVPKDKITLFFLRVQVKRDEQPAWWPQIRLPNGSYGFAFAL